MDDKLKERMDLREERKQQLYNKPVSELVGMIIALEEENQKVKEYRKKLIQIRNLVSLDSEKKPQGRPRKEDVKDFI